MAERFTDDQVARHNRAMTELILALEVRSLIKAEDQAYQSANEAVLSKGQVVADLQAGHFRDETVVVES